MSGAETVNDESEVGFNQTFGSHWYRAEQAGRALMVLFTLAAGRGFLGRGPFGHATARSASGAPVVDYEPVARRGTGTMITVHVRRPGVAPHRIELPVNRQIIEAMG